VSSLAPETIKVVHHICRGTTFWLPFSAYIVLGQRQGDSWQLWW